MATLPPTPPAAAGAPPAPAAPATDTAAQLDLLARLGELRQAGVLTEDEFEAKKQKILEGA